MEDSATLYVPLSGCDLSKEGYYCQNGVTGVTLKYGCSSLGWNYYTLIDNEPASDCPTK